MGMERGAGEKGRENEGRERKDWKKGKKGGGVHIGMFLYNLKP